MGAFDNIDFPWESSGGNDPFIAPTGPSSPPSLREYNQGEGNILNGTTYAAPSSSPFIRTVMSNGLPSTVGNAPSFNYGDLSGVNLTRGGKKTYDGPDKSFEDISDEDFARDEVTRKRVERESGISQGRIDPMMSMFEAQRRQMIARRNAAIAAAGRGAAAPYSAAIARIDRQVQELKDQMPIIQDVYGQKIQNQYDIYDRAASELGTSYDDALAYSAEVSDEQISAIRSHFSDGQDRAAEIVQKIGGDVATAHEVAQEVGRMEEQIITMSEVSAAGIQGIMQAAENLAVKSAIATGATNALDLKRKQLDVELGIKEKLRDLAQARQDQIRARSAAVRSARAMAAARWPAGMPINQQGFMQTSVARYFDGQKINPEAGKMAADFVEMGMSHNDLRLVLNNTRNGKPNADAIAILDKFNIDPGAWSSIPDEIKSDFGTVANGLEIYTTAGNDYQERFVGSDPRDFEQNSAARAMAGAEWARQWGHDEQDAFYMGREMAEMNDDQLGYLDEFDSGATPTFTTVSGKSAYDTIEQARYNEAWRQNVEKFQ